MPKHRAEEFYHSPLTPGRSRLGHLLTELLRRAPILDSRERIAARCKLHKSHSADNTHRCLYRALRPNCPPVTQNKSEGDQMRRKRVSWYPKSPFQRGGGFW